MPYVNIYFDDGTYPLASELKEQRKLAGVCQDAVKQWGYNEGTLPITEKNLFEKKAKRKKLDIEISKLEKRRKNIKDKNKADDKKKGELHQVAEANKEKEAQDIKKLKKDFKQELKEQGKQLGAKEFNKVFKNWIEQYKTDNKIGYPKWIKENI